MILWLKHVLWRAHGLVSECRKALQALFQANVVECNAFCISLTKKLFQFHFFFFLITVIDITKPFLTHNSGEWIFTFTKLSGCCQSKTRSLFISLCSGKLLFASLLPQRKQCFPKWCQSTSSAKLAGSTSWLNPQSLLCTQLLSCVPVMWAQRDLSLVSVQLGQVGIIPWASVSFFHDFKMLCFASSCTTA